ncbi:MAG: hypothetical protein IT384_12460 [Deltaproteobacteria bacterium]|nr:hypothetical protein [Deltaproteobacteria bacterium]
MSDALHLGEDLAAMAAGGTDLGADRRAELERHLAACAECRRALEEARTLFAALDRLPARAPSAGFDRAMFARLDAVDRESQASTWSVLRAFFTPPRVAIGSALAAGLVLGLIALPPSGSELPPGGEELASEGSLLLEGEVDGLEVAEKLEMLRDLEVLENLDVIDDLETISELEEREPG